MINDAFRLKKVKRLKSETQLLFSTKQDIDEMILAQHEGKPGYLAFSEDEISDKVLEIMRDRSFGVPENGMSPSQILRGKVYKLWINKYQDHYTEEDFYLNWMNHFNKIIDELLQQ